jgi:hypothetical protein
VLLRKQHVTCKSHVTQANPTSSLPSVTNTIPASYSTQGLFTSVIYTLHTVYYYYYYYLVCEAIATVATPGLLCQPQVMVKMIVKKQMECRLAGETEVLGENLPQRHFCPSQNAT